MSVLESIRNPQTKPRDYRYRGYAFGLLWLTAAGFGAFLSGWSWEPFAGAWFVVASLLMQRHFDIEYQ